MSGTEQQVIGFACLVFLILVVVPVLARKHRKWTEIFQALYNRIRYGKQEKPKRTVPADAFPPYVPFTDESRTTDPVVSENMQKAFAKLVSEIFTEYYKPLKWKKEGNNYRFISDDGLGKVINFQRARYNTQDKVKFYINYGVYIETSETISNKTFKEYDCQFRSRTRYARGVYEMSKTYINSIKDTVLTALKEATELFETIPSREEFIRLVLSGDLQEKADCNIMHCGTCRLFYQMGYYKEIYEIARCIDTPPFIELTKEIEEKIHGEKCL
ncbi:MAG: DUF4304 domain-containing protein [Oscillospiraceae bacterium]|nr:DUF4304 domain-containing protein [Oscillospiraceae bacterium]